MLLRGLPWQPEEPSLPGSGTDHARSFGRLFPQKTSSRDQALPERPGGLQDAYREMALT